MHVQYSVHTVAILCIYSIVEKAATYHIKYTVLYIGRTRPCSRRSPLARAVALNQNNNSERAQIIVLHQIKNICNGIPLTKLFRKNNIDLEKLRKLNL